MWAQAWGSLDKVKLECGHDNFSRLHEIVDNIQFPDSADGKQRKKSIHDMLNRSEYHLRTEFVPHTIMIANGGWREKGEDGSYAIKIVGEDEPNPLVLDCHHNRQYAFADVPVPAKSMAMLGQYAASPPESSGVPGSAWSGACIVVPVDLHGPIRSACLDCIESRRATEIVGAALHEHGWRFQAVAVDPTNVDDTAAYDAAASDDADAFLSFEKDVADMSIEDVKVELSKCGERTLRLMAHQLRCATQSRHIKLLEELVATDPSHIHIIIDFKVHGFALVSVLKCDLFRQHIYTV